jgi:hypothetical protein
MLVWNLGKAKYKQKNKTSKKFQGVFRIIMKQENITEI